MKDLKREMMESTALIDRLYKQRTTNYTELINVIIRMKQEIDKANDKSARNTVISLLKDMIKIL